jgi:hypothetical protein
MFIRFRRNVFTEQLRGDSPGIFDVFAGRYQVTALVQSHRSETGLYATVFCEKYKL